MSLNKIYGFYPFKIIISLTSVISVLYQVSSLFFPSCSKMVNKTQKHNKKSLFFSCLLWSWLSQPADKHDPQAIRAYTVYTVAQLRGNSEKWQWRGNASNLLRANEVGLYWIRALQFSWLLTFYWNSYLGHFFQFSWFAVRCFAEFFMAHFLCISVFYPCGWLKYKVQKWKGKT